MNKHSHYIKFVLPIVVALMTFTGSLLYAQEDNTLLTLLGSVPQEPVFPQMEAMTISYADYRAIERANGVPNPANRREFEIMDDTIRAWWQSSLLRVHAGPANLVNLTQDKINDMPELIGFDYFDIDQALIYGVNPFQGTVIHSEEQSFDWARTSDALADRDYDPRRTSAGIAWGKGGDGQTDVDNIVLGDPFGGDVGLASRVVVLDETQVANSFLWAIALSTADAHTGEASALSEMAEYGVMAGALQPKDGELLQAVILNTLAGENQQVADGQDSLPPYTLGAIADVQRAETQVHEVVLVYEDVRAARAAAEQLDDLMSAFDNGWMQTIGFEAAPVTVERDGRFFVVSYSITAPAPSPQEVQEGAFEPGLVFGFWATAIQRGDFFPLAIAP